MKLRNLTFPALTSLLLASAALAEGDAAKGEKSFKKCAQCHRILSPEGDMVVKGGMTGPNLWGVIGRVAAGDANFRKYGDSLKALGETGFTWSEEDITVYARDPKAFLRERLDDGSARALMTFKLKDASDIAAYLATFAADTGE
ncbi:MAG: c-type cytochrome [Maritimibacter sp.]